MNPIFLSLVLCKVMMIGLIYFVYRGSGHTYKKKELDELKKANELLSAEIQSIREGKM